MCGNSVKPAGRPFIILDGKYTVANDEYLKQASVIFVPLIFVSVITGLTGISDDDGDDEQSISLLYQNQPKNYLIGNFNRI